MQIYSATDAPISWGSFLFTVPHFVFGMVCLVGLLRGKVWFRGSKVWGVAFQALFAATFAGLIGFSFAKNWFDTMSCKGILASSEDELVTGVIKIDRRFAKPGYGYIEFSVGNWKLRTGTAGLGCDCGYVLPVGRAVTLEAGMRVHARVRGAVVLALERLD